jgi:hypothetical protein
MHPAPMKGALALAPSGLRAGYAHPDKHMRAKPSLLTVHYEASTSLARSAATASAR